MNKSVAKSFLSFFWILPFLYMFLDIYTNLDYRMPTYAFKFFIFLSFISAFILIVIWFKEFREIGYFTKAFQYLKEENISKLDGIISKTKTTAYIENDITLLQYAIDHQLNPDIISYLISRNATIKYSLNREYDLSHTLFYLCAYYNYLDETLLSYLLAKGANVNFIDTNKGFEGLSILQVLVLRGNTNCISMVLEQEADLKYFVNELSMNALMLAARYINDPLVLKILIEAGALVNELNKDGYNALLFACHYNTTPAVINILCNSGAKIKTYNVKSAQMIYNEVTPLSIAATYNNSEVVKCLIALGDDLNYKDTFDFSVIFMAAAHNPNVEVLKTLISSGASLEGSEDRDGNTPLMVASYLNPNPNIIRYLIDKTHNLKTKNKDGFDFIDYLKQNSHLTSEEKEMVITRWL
ncbi:ankyrin repeat domain-containing protein [Candidatus Hepatincolaceae symbiont of Richtersius coronifer]